MPFSRLYPEILLVNANVVTMSSYRPRANLVAVSGNRIVWVGERETLGRSDWNGTTIIDCQGNTLIPGFIDAHCHLMSYASSFLGVDCSPNKVRSIIDIQHRLGEEAQHIPNGKWIRGHGYDEFWLSEKRHPSRQELDAAAPNNPVKLSHRSGHGCVLNSFALSLAEISSNTVEPLEGYIERDQHTGEPTGLLLEMERFLDGIVPLHSESDFKRGISYASERLVSLGITSLQDATHSNSVERWNVLNRLKHEGHLTPRVTMMMGYRYLDDFLNEGLSIDSGTDHINLGPVKIMLTRTTGDFHPSMDDIRRIVFKARNAGFQIAIHTVEAEAVEAAIDVLVSNRRQFHQSNRDRLEHCSECSTAVLNRLQSSGLMVVTQPGFLYYNGKRYLSSVSEDRHSWLYRLRSLIDIGITTAASSDAPVIEPNPLMGIYAAVTRRSESGELVGSSEAISTFEAINMYTMGGAYVARQEADKGSIEEGKLADLVLLDNDPISIHPDQLPGIKVIMTMIGGQVAWSA